jgi:hypothetical protein
LLSTAHLCCVFAVGLAARLLVCGCVVALRLLRPVLGLRRGRDVLRHSGRAGRSSFLIYNVSRSAGQHPAEAFVAVGNLSSRCSVCREPWCVRLVDGPLVRIFPSSATFL